MSKDNFQWTDELILEFVRFTMADSPTFQGRYQDLEDFKASHQPKEQSKPEKDWEIVEMYNNRIGRHKPITESDNWYSCKDAKCTIHSVKRLSDGEVFSIGDSVCLNWYVPFDVKQPIERFEIVNDRMVVHYGAGSYDLKYCMINPKHKIQKSKPIEKERDIVLEEILMRQQASITRYEKEMEGLYTKQDLEDAFSAAKKDAEIIHLGGYEFKFVNEKYPTFQDYLKAKK